ncbi:MAG TPA: alpha/beta hydrolase [Isosphaeraceae bacterium]|jgi:hypothetical protein|nr:alpha/beta hydrolase [Isosphaeraceae bacterium]
METAAPLRAATLGKGKVWRPVWRVVRIVLLVYLGVALVLSRFQARLIFPGAETKGRPEAAFDPPPDCSLVALRAAGGERVMALFGPALGERGEPLADAEERPTLIYFYGNGMCLRDALDEFQRFRRLGANVLAPEYVGFGLSEGDPSEAGCYATADAAYDYLVNRPGIDRTKIVPAGWSLGAAVAIDLAARRQVAGLATFSAFTSMVDMAQRQFPFLPISLLLRHRFDSEKKIATIDAPILIGHSRDDTLIPHTMADRLERAVPKGQVTRVNVDGADHNEFFAVGAGKIFPALQQFLQRLSRPGR